MQVNSSQGPCSVTLVRTGSSTFCALGVRWIFEFANDQSSVLTSEGFVAAFQVFIAEAALHTPVLVESTVRIHVRVIADATRDVDDITIDDSEPEIRVQAGSVGLSHRRGGKRRRDPRAVLPVAPGRPRSEPSRIAGHPRPAVPGRPPAQGFGRQAL